MSGQGLLPARFAGKLSEYRKPEPTPLEGFSFFDRPSGRASAVGQALGGRAFG